MYITKIKDYDIEAKEADIIVSDGKYEILCYAQPFENKTNSSFILSAFRDDNIMRGLEEICFVEKIHDGYYDYRLQGKLIDLEKRLVSIGDIVIELGNGIPKDINQNDYIEFTVMRVDFVEQ